MIFSVLQFEDERARETKKRLACEHDFTAYIIIIII